MFLSFNSLLSTILGWTGLFLFFPRLVILCVESLLLFLLRITKPPAIHRDQSAIRFCSLAVIECTVLRQGRTNIGAANITVFCDVTLYSEVDNYRCFR
jgi:hypothetical protein